MTSEQLEKYSPQFVQRLKELVPKEQWDKLHICPSGLAVVVDAEKKIFSLLGCPFCLLEKPGQDSHGYPTIGGQKLLGWEEYPHTGDNTSPEVAANTWHCPICGVMVVGLLPNFNAIDHTF